MTLQDFAGMAEVLEDSFSKEDRLFVFRLLCRDVALLKGGDLFPPKYLLISKLKDISQKGWEKVVEEKLLAIKPLAFPLSELMGSEKSKVNGSLIVKVGPLMINFVNKEAFYFVSVGVEFEGIKPALWSKKKRLGFWDTLLKAVEAQIPSETKLEPLKPISKENALVKVGMHAELQKFGKKPKSPQLSLFDRLELNTIAEGEVEKHNIEAFGIDITQAQNQALFAIQKLLYETNYSGNSKGFQLNGKNRFEFSGYLPVLKITPTQYLEAYGVKKYLTSRGKEEFGGEERRRALQSLVDLATKPRLLVYKRIYWTTNNKKQKEEKIDRIETIAPLIKIMQGWESLTKQEDQRLDSGKSTQATDDKLRVLVIETAPILVDQINTYFVLKPANCYQEIRLLAPHASKYVPRFIDYLLAQAELHRRKNKEWDWVIRRNYENLACALRMDNWIRTRNWKQIRGCLKKCYEIAKQLSYLLDYKTTQGATQEVEELILNPEKFKRVQEIESDRK